MARLFFALRIPLSVRADIHARVKSVLPERHFRIVVTENIHITMAFIGQVDDDARARAVSLSQSFRTPEGTPVSISGAGAFPGPGRPSVVWLGIGDGAAIMHDIHTRLVRELERASLPFDPKPLRPHLTVAYRRKSRKPGTEDRGEVRQVMATLLHESASWEWRFPLPEVKLYESTLHKTGAVYTEL